MCVSVSGKKGENAVEAVSVDKQKCEQVKGLAEKGGMPKSEANQ